MSDREGGPALADLLPWIDRPCSVMIGGITLPMTLIAATPLPGSPREQGGFELEWLGPSAPVLAQGMAEITGPDGVTHAIFLVPTAHDAAGTRYVATFF